LFQRREFFFQRQSSLAGVFVFAVLRGFARAMGFCGRSAEGMCVAGFFLNALVRQTPNNRAPNNSDGVMAFRREFGKKRFHFGKRRKGVHTFGARAQLSGRLSAAQKKFVKNSGGDEGRFFYKK
jgi:acyl dehydratase